MKNWKKLKKEILKDSAVKEAYEALGVEYQIIKEVIRLRNKNKITQNELANKMGTSQSALSRFESGSMKNPSLDFLKRIAEGLNMKLNISFK